jgi:hypothetical protein
MWLFMPSDLKRMAVDHPVSHLLDQGTQPLREVPKAGAHMELLHLVLTSMARSRAVCLRATQLTQLLPQSFIFS